MGATSSSSTNSSVAATNPELNKLFTTLFGGGLTQGASSTLQGIMSGTQLTSNTSQLYKTLSQATSTQYGQGMSQIREQMGKAGLTDSTSLSQGMGGYTNQYLSNLTNISTQMGLQETQMQGGVAGNIISMLSTAGSQYYTDKSTTTTQMPWTNTFSSLMGGAIGAAGLFAGGGSSAISGVQNLFGG